MLHFLVQKWPKAYHADHKQPVTTALLCQNMCFDGGFLKRLQTFAQQPPGNQTN